jgi:hypothetical protein
VPPRFESSRFRKPLGTWTPPQRGDALGGFSVLHGEKPPDAVFLHMKAAEAATSCASAAATALAAANTVAASATSALAAAFPWEVPAPGTTIVRLRFDELPEHISQDPSHLRLLQKNLASLNVALLLNDAEERGLPLHRPQQIAGRRRPPSLLIDDAPFSGRSRRISPLKSGVQQRIAADSLSTHDPALEAAPSSARVHARRRTIAVEPDDALPRPAKEVALTVHRSSVHKEVASTTPRRRGAHGPAMAVSSGAAVAEYDKASLPRGVRLPAAAKERKLPYVPLLLAMPGGHIVLQDPGTVPDHLASQMPYPPALMKPAASSLDGVLETTPRRARKVMATEVAPAYPYPHYSLREDRLMGALALS